MDETQAPNGPVSPCAPAPAPLGKPVLVVDDSEVSRRILVALLEQEGHEADEAKSGEEALEKVRARGYGLVLLDCRLPGMDGAETAGRLRQTEHGTDCLVVGMSAEAGEATRAACRSAGMDAFLEKPLLREDVQGLFARAPERQAPSAGSSGPLAFFGVSASDADVARTLTECFAEDLETRLPSLEEALGREDYPRLMSQAHALKGSYGFEESGAFHETARALEKAAEKADAPACRRHLKTLREGFTRALRWLEQA